MKKESIITALLTGCLLWLIMACFCIGLLASFGCASSKPCLPEVQIQEVDVPQPCVIHVTPPPEPEYLEYPDYNDENVKDWYLEVERVARTNRALREDYINRLLGLIEEHNRLEPQCKQ